MYVGRLGKSECLEVIYVYGHATRGERGYVVMGYQHTKKSMSRFPAPPNSRSPTWNVTVILSSRCNCSWKHSFSWALSWILWAREEWMERRATRIVGKREDSMMMNVSYMAKASLGLEMRSRLKWSKLLSISLIFCCKVFCFEDCGDHVGPPILHCTRSWGKMLGEYP